MSSCNMQENSRFYSSLPPILAKQILTCRQASGQAIVTASPARATTQGIYLNTLPSAHSYGLPLSSIGLSHDHMSSTNSRSSFLLGSSLTNS